MKRSMSENNSESDDNVNDGANNVSSGNVSNASGNHSNSSINNSRGPKRFRNEETIRLLIPSRVSTNSKLWIILVFSRYSVKFTM